MRRLVPLLLVAAALGAAAWWALDGSGDADGETIARSHGNESIDAARDANARAAASAGGPALVGAPAAPTAPGGASSDGTSAEAADGKPVGGAVAAPGALRATVLGTDGRPVVDATLRLFGGGTVWAARTDAEGKVSLDAPYGRYDLWVVARGGSWFRPGFVLDGRSGLDLQVELAAGARVTVVVLRGGEGLQGARVSVIRRVRGADLLTIPGAAPTDRDGRAVVEGVPPGAYKLAVAVDDGPPIEQPLDVSEDVAVKLEIPKVVFFSGRVADAETRLPVADAEVRLELKAMGGTFPMTARTDADGRFRVGVPQGRPNLLTVRASGYAPWPSEKGLKTELQALQPLAKGEEVVREMSLVRGARVHGRVIVPQGRVFEAGVLEFTDRRGRTAIGVAASTEYLAEHLSAGSWLVTVTTGGWYPETPLSVVVPSDDADVTFDVRLVPSRTLSGTVLLAEGTPATGAHVWLVEGGVQRGATEAGREVETFTSTDGGWRISDVPANQTVVLRAALGGLEAAPLALPAGDARGDVVLRLASTATLKGRVVDVGTRGGVAGATVRCTPSGEPGGRDARTVTADASGEFTIAGLMDGAWEVVPKKADLYLPAAPVVVRATSESKEIETELCLDPGLVVAGRVASEDGTPIVGAVVRIDGKPDEGPAIGRRTVTDERGGFRLSGLVLGRYAARVRAEGFVTAVTDGLRGGEQRLDLRLVRRPP